MLNSDKIEGIEIGVDDYGFYYLPKSAFSNDEIEELKVLFVVDEVEITDDMIEEGIENIEDPLGENYRWHYSFSKKD